MDTDQPSWREVYQLRIQLRGISPPIWRRVLVGSDATMADLHAVIQAAVGWEDGHLHRFTIRGQWYGLPREGALSFHAGVQNLNLTAFGLRLHERFSYEYDFYSNWIHDIRVEQILAGESVRRAPVCIDGKGGCPPEESGPPDRFMEALDEHTGYDFVTWLEEELENPHLDRCALRDALREWEPWLEWRFDRRATNARLEQLRAL